LFEFTPGSHLSRRHLRQTQPWRFRPPLNGLGRVSFPTPFVRLRYLQTGSLDSVDPFYGKIAVALLSLRFLSSPARGAPTMTFFPLTPLPQGFGNGHPVRFPFRSADKTKKPPQLAFPCACPPCVPMDFFFFFPFPGLFFTDSLFFRPPLFDHLYSFGAIQAYLVPSFSIMKWLTHGCPILKTNPLFSSYGKTSNGVLVWAGPQTMLVRSIDSFDTYRDTRFCNSAQVVLRKKLYPPFLSPDASLTVRFFPFFRFLGPF